VAFLIERGALADTSIATADRSALMNARREPPDFWRIRTLAQRIGPPVAFMTCRR